MTKRIHKRPIGPEAIRGAALPGRLLAQLGWVALRDAEGQLPDPYAWPPLPPAEPERVREAERLRVLAYRLFYKAREAGFVEMSLDATFGLEQVPT